MFDVNLIRQDFPLLEVSVNGRKIVYFDNAATTQKPYQVIKAIESYYKETNSNVHRGVHFLAEKATEEYENSRQKVKEFINAESSNEIIFLRGTTEAINLVANSFGEIAIKEGDEIIISTLEHHSNIVPWQILCERKKAKLKVIPISLDGELNLNEFEKLLSKKTKIVSVSYVSNTLGVINPVKRIIELSHKYDIPVMLDAAQAVQHIKVDVQALDCDFLAFSGHKIYGPTGIGVLYGKEKYLEAMPPFLAGGEMIKSVSFEKTTYNDLPYKFEAGTPNIEGGIVLASAIEYVESLGLDNIAEYERSLLNYCTERLMGCNNVKIYGNTENKSSIVSFLIGNIHPYDAGVILNNLGIAVRTGYHCTEPLMRFFNIPGTVRASFAFYNTKDEIDVLIDGIQKINKLLG
ncbi:MAG: aminotransferase class V-fold PLP-dependent enzyme [Ignavibacteria bacterium]